MMTNKPNPTADESNDTRKRILAAATRLVAAGGEEAATTRAVADAASVQAPTIYRLFGDKRGLLDAVAEEAYANYIIKKVRREPEADPIDDLMKGWDDFIEFGLANPAIFNLMRTTYPEPPSKVALAGLAVLRAKVGRLARVGRLRVSEEHAVDLIHAAGNGCVLSLLAKAPDRRGVLPDAARNAIFSQIIEGYPIKIGSGLSSIANALRSRLGEDSVLSPGERLLLDEMLQKFTDRV
ncbi:TetR/AcrR family transcriptional regulator (plasmid) [Rhizobium sp. RCAM05350]|uniref:TetR/AcrR family transcriptional regulator n=1 Tax=Rhizobium sp. RCAM05350 TaxID=2895568 RepID=UPI002076B257|nr:TetR/AcrR family transcriptional regulator [Rhizobium sp. RCAM05350]URK89419.1 TetR/AcrR family transcriptional regulator [Rhizobium sp. RCAM05350]